MALSTRVLVTLVIFLNLFLNATEAFLEPDCAKKISQALCSTYYAKSLSVCLGKLSDANQLTWDEKGQNICAVRNLKLCISARICKISAEGVTTTATEAPTSPTTTTTSLTTMPPVTTTPSVNTKTPVTTTTPVSLLQKRRPLKECHSSKIP